MGFGRLHFTAVKTANSKAMHLFAFAAVTLAVSATGCSTQVSNIPETTTLKAPALDYGATQTLTIGVTSGIIAPANTGGTPTFCAVSNGVLPPGLTLQSDCTITGAPTTPAPVATVEISATNAYGRADPVTLSILVNDTVPAIFFVPSTLTLTRTTALPTLTPLSTGGTITGCSVTSGILPAGLALSALCVLSGTPTVVAATSLVSITATNSVGSSSAATLTITVNDLIPTLSYTGSPFSWGTGVAITPVAPTVTGGPATSCPITAGAVPTGITLAADCSLSGTPTVVSTGSFSFRPTNSGGTGAVKTLGYAVIPLAPAISFSGSPFTWTRGTSVGSITPTNSGGTATSCPVTSGALPTGISVSSTCVISGIPSVVYGPAASVTLTPANTGGSGVPVVLSITVNDIAPVISFSSTAYAWLLGSAIATVTPTNAGGTPTLCDTVPSGTLPAGLSISAGCAITGTPSALGSLTTITIQASNTGGTSATTNLSYSVTASIPSITYLGAPFTGLKIGTAITPLTPTNSGSSITSCTVTSGTLPSGLSLSSACVISGTPSAVQNATDVTIQATNSAGSGSATISFTVRGMYAYVANTGANTISKYTINASTGVMTSLGTIGSGSTPVAIAVHPQGTFAYAVNQGDATVSMYSIAAATGQLTSISTVPTGGTPTDIVVDPRGTYAYVTNQDDDSISRYSIDATTGVLTPVISIATESGPVSLAMDLLGRFAYAVSSAPNVAMYSQTAATGVLVPTDPATLFAGVNFTGIAASDKFVYATDFNNDQLSMFTVNQSTGVLTSAASPIGTGSNPYGVAVDPLNRFVYVANQGGGSVSCYTISNSTTGALTAMTPSTIGAGAFPVAVTVDPSGRYAYALNAFSNSVSMYTIDQSTGALTANTPATRGTGLSPTAIAISY